MPLVGSACWSAVAKGPPTAKSTPEPVVGAPDVSAEADSPVAEAIAGMPRAARSCCSSRRKASISWGSPLPLAGVAFVPRGRAESSPSTFSMLCLLNLHSEDLLVGLYHLVAHLEGQLEGQALQFAGDGYVVEVYRFA